MGQKDFRERRHYKRIKRHFILTYFDLQYPSVKYSASQLKNISLGGVCLITSKEFPNTTRLGIELKTPFISELTHLEGTVVESRERIKNIIYETHLKFNHLSGQAKFILDKIMKYFENEESQNHE